MDTLKPDPLSTNGLVKYLRRLNTPTLDAPRNLPFYHACTYDEASTYVPERKIRKEMCDVFERPLVYVFLGRSQFRRNFADETIKLTPVCFLIRPTAKLTIWQTYPFDTGAMTLGLYAPAIPSNGIERLKAKFALTTDLLIAYRLIHLFFGSLENYLYFICENLTRKQIEMLSVSENIPEIEDLYNIYTANYLGADKRRKTVEVILEDDVELNKDNLAGMLIPVDFEMNVEFDELFNETGAEPLIYDKEMQLFRETYYSLITKQSINISMNYINQS